MATTAEKIRQRIQRAIPEMTNVSAASIWGRIADVCGITIDEVRSEIGRSEMIIDNAAKNRRMLNRQWYLDKAYEFQYGDNLTVIDEATQAEGYAIIDTTKQIIKQAAIDMIDDGQIIFKVATVDENSNIIRLSELQHQNFLDYIAHFITFGLSIIIISKDADIFNAMKLYIKYRNDYSLVNLQQKLIGTLRDIQTSFRSGVPLYINDIEETIRAIDGIRDAWFQNPYATYIIDGEEQIINPVNNSLSLNSGYFNFNPDFYDFTKSLTIFTPVQ